MLRRRLESELKDLKNCESFSFLNVTETGITNDVKYAVSWIVEVNKIDNNKGQLKVEFSFPSIFTLLFFIFLKLTFIQ